MPSRFSVPGKASSLMGEGPPKSREQDRVSNLRIHVQKKKDMEAIRVTPSGAGGQIQEDARNHRRGIERQIDVKTRLLNQAWDRPKAEPVLCFGDIRYRDGLRNLQAATRNLGTPFRLSRRQGRADSSVVARKVLNRAGAKGWAYSTGSENNK